MRPTQTDSTEAVDPRETEARLARISHTRLQRVLAGLSARHRDFLHLLPLLFHTNAPNIPGYIDDDVPCGIIDYSPTPQAIRAAREHNRAFPERVEPPRTTQIYGLYLIGSVGSVGQSRGSDFDLWVCYDEGLDAAAVAALIKKAEVIEAYAGDLSLEVHFFVFSPADYRAGRSLDLSAESSGSSQHFLLLDEFYRSGLVLAGVNPLWWRIPASAEREYDACRTALLEQRAITGRSHADFGGIVEVPVNEFFGAALWQLSKGIDSPHKSVLKLLLMEAYAAGYPQTQLLSHRFKRLVEEGFEDAAQIDPYVLMYRGVETYLLATEDATRLELLRRAFYLKSGAMLSRPRRSVDSWRHEIFEQLTQDWGWSQTHVKHLDEHERWPIEEVFDEMRAIVACFKKSYHVLSELAKKIDDRRITHEDLTILGRQLYAAFERKPGKIDLVNRGIAPRAAEPELVVSGAARQGVLEILRPDEGMRAPRTGTPSRATQPVKRGRQLVEIVAWAYLNRVADQATRWWSQDASTEVNAQDLSFITTTMAERSAEMLARKPAADAFARPAAIDRCLVFINVGAEPPLRHAGSGSVIASGRTDAFEYGGAGQNLIARVDVILRTTWGEYFTEGFSGDEALPHTAALLLKWRFTPDDADAIFIACASRDYRNLIEARARHYLEHVLQHLPPSTAHNLVHITRIGGRPHAIIQTATGNRVLTLNRLAELERVSSELPLAPTQVVFDAQYFHDTPVARVLAANRPGTWQLFWVEADTDEVAFAVLDEHGALYWESHTGEPGHQLIAHYWRFLSAIHARRSREAPGFADATPALEAIRLTREGANAWRQSEVDLAPPAPGSYMEFRVMGEMRASKLREVILVCDDQEYSSTEYGKDVYRAAADHVLARRKGSGEYPIYVTDMDIRDPQTENSATDLIPLTRLMRYRAVVEQRLTTEVLQRTRAPAAPDQP